MTFDEMIKELEDMGDEYFIEPLAILQEIEQLRETYAKPVEMTREQLTFINLYKQNDNFIHLINAIDDNEFKEYYIFKNVSDEDLMRAWLHPEVIKVVGA